MQRWKTFGRAVGAWLVTMGGLLVAWSGIAPAQAAFPGPNGVIAFEAQLGGSDSSSEICSLSADGQGGAHRLTSDGSPDRDPHWFADGSKVLWVSERESSNNDTLFTMNPDGSAQTQLVAGGTDNDPSMAPDKSFVVVSVSGNEVGIERINLPSGTRARLTAPPYRDRDPEVSPDGTKVAFDRDMTAPKRDDEIWIVNADGSNAHREVAARTRRGTSRVGRLTDRRSRSSASASPVLTIRTSS